MIKYWLNRLVGNPTVRVFGPGTGLLYRENGTAIQIRLQSSSVGYLIDVSTIISWEDESARVLSQADRMRVAQAAKSVVESQWGEVCMLV